MNLNSGLHLAANDKNANAIQQTITNTMKQQWTVSGLANGYYCMASRYYGGTGYLKTAGRYTMKVTVVRKMCAMKKEY